MSEALLPRFKRKWLLAALVLLAGSTLALYFPAGKFEFTNWDDSMYITQNFLIHKITPDRVGKIFTSLIFANYHPVTLLSYALQYSVFGAQPAGYHWVNIGFHTINVLLLFFLLIQISGSIFLAVLTAVIFGLHPVQVESVAWVSSHKTLLSAFFSLAALQGYWLFLKSGQKRFYAMALIGFVLAVFSKPTAITIPLIFAGLDRLMFKTSLRKGLTRVLPFLFFAGVELFLVCAAHLKEKAIAPLADSGFLAQGLFPFWTLAIYLKKIFCPNDLMALYPGLSNSDWHHPSFFLPAIFTLFMILFAVFTRKRFGTLAAALGGYTILLLPTMNLVPLSAPIADRYLYLPIILPVVFTAGLIEKLFKKAGSPVYKLLCLALILTTGTLLFTLSRQNLRNWRDSFTLWNSVLNKTPRHALAHVKLGEAYYEKGKLDEAIREVSQGVSLGLNNPVFAKNLVAMYMDKGDYARARQSALAFVEQVPGDERFYIQLGLIESKDNPEKAETYFKKATDVNPKNPFAWYHLGRFHLERQNNPEAAYACFLKSLALDSYQADFHIAVADCLSRVGSYPQAIQVLRYALTLDENSVNAWLNLGNLFKLTGDDTSSRRALEKAYQLEPSLKPAGKPARVDYSS